MDRTPRKAVEKRQAFDKWRACGTVLLRQWKVDSAREDAKAIRPGVDQDAPDSLAIRRAGHANGDRREGLIERVVGRTSVDDDWHHVRNRTRPRTRTGSTRRCRRAA